MCYGNLEHKSWNHYGILTNKVIFLIGTMAKNNSNIPSILKKAIFLTFECMCGPIKLQNFKFYLMCRTFGQISVTLVSSALHPVYELCKLQNQFLELGHWGVSCSSILVWL